MKVFISWSGEVSHAVALGLKEWLPNVIQALEPFVSSEDIAKGGRWLAKINAELEGAQFGVICLTPQNLQSPWVLFEAGALSVRFAEGRVAPLLIGLSSVNVTPPLSQFQATEPERNQMLKLVQDINMCLEDKPLPKERLERAFEHHWTDIDAILRAQIAKAKAAPFAPARKRDVESMMSEVLELVRSLHREQGEGRVKEVRGLIARAMAEGELLHRAEENRAALGPLSRMRLRDIFGDAGKDIITDVSGGSSLSGPPSSTTPKVG